MRPPRLAPHRGSSTPSGLSRAGPRAALQECRPPELLYVHGRQYVFSQTGKKRHHGPANVSVRGRASPPGGCTPPGTRSGREAWPLGPFGGVAAARPPAGRGASAPAGRGAVRHGAAPACAHCHGVQGHAGRRRKCRRGILFAPDDALDYMGCHPRGTRGRPRSHAGRGGASLPVWQSRCTPVADLHYTPVPRAL